MPNKLKYSFETGSMSVVKDPEVSRWMSSISKGRTKKRWFYSGDRDMANGGFFYNLDNWPDYVDVWRITPYSDAGGHDNQFWLEELTLLTDPKVERWVQQIKEALKSCGWDEDPPSLTVRQMRHRIVGALTGYGGYDQNSSRVIQLGPRPDEFYGGREESLKPDIVLRSGTDLKKWLRARVNAL